MRCTWTSWWNISPTRCTAPYAITQSKSRRCPSCLFVSTCTRSFDHLLTSIRLAYVIEISNLKMCCSIRQQGSAKCAILAGKTKEKQGQFAILCWSPPQSAKVLVPGEPNVSYICSRYYRAPELIFGATNYTLNIDIWSTGCVMAEMLLGQPFFPGDSGIDQLVEIIKILGTPTKDEIAAMNASYVEHRFPQIKPHPLHKVSEWMSDGGRMMIHANIILRLDFCRSSWISHWSHVKNAAIPSSTSYQCHWSFMSSILWSIAWSRSTTPQWPCTTTLIQLFKAGYVL